MKNEKEKKKRIKNKEKKKVNGQGLIGCVIKGRLSDKNVLPRYPSDNGQGVLISD